MVVAHTMAVLSAAASVLRPVRMAFKLCALEPGIRAECLHVHCVGVSRNMPYGYDVLKSLDISIYNSTFQRSCVDVDEDTRTEGGSGCIVES